MSEFDRETFRITVVRGLKVEVDSANRPLPASEWKPTLAVYGFDRDGVISQQLEYINWDGNPLSQYNNNFLIGYHQVINVNAGDTIEWRLDSNLITPRPEFVPHGFGPDGTLTEEQLEDFRGWGLQIGIPLDGFSTRLEGQQYYKDQGLDIVSKFPALSEQIGDYSLYNLIEGYSKWENLCASSTGEDDIIFASPLGECDSCNDIAPDMYGEDFTGSRREIWQNLGSNSSLYETRLGVIGRKYFTCYPRYCNGSSPESNSSIVFGPTPYVNIRYRGAVSGPNTNVTTTAAPCIPNEDDIPRDKPEKAKLIYDSGSVSIPTGENIHLQIGDNKYPLLHENSAEVSGGQKMVSVANIVSDTSVTFSELILSFKEELDISGQVSISISSHEDKLLLGQKIISAPVKDIVFSCSDIINNIDLQNKTVLITIMSICSSDKEDCCEDLKCIQLFDEVTNVCIDDPCNITMPLITFFSTKTRTRLLLHDGNYVVLDTGYVNTLNDDIENYLSYEGSDVVFTNNFGASYVLDYYPAVITNIGSLPKDCDKKVYNKTDLYRYKCFDFNSAVNNTKTWVFPFDICDLTACINPDGEIPPPAPE